MPQGKAKAMYEHYNPNPVRTDGVGDCAVRAVAKALDVTWEKAYAMLSANGFLMGDLPSSDVVWGSVLRQHGFTRQIIPNICPDCYTVEDFIEAHPQGIYALKSEGHVAVVKDGVLYDSWDSRNTVPIYYWTKEGK